VISNYYTFQFLVSTFNSALRGRQIREVYSQDADELAIAFHNDPTQLVFLCRPDVSVAFLHDSRSRARRNSVDLLGGASGARVDTVAMSPSDRVMLFTLDNRTTLAAVLYGPRANVLLVGDSGRILDSFKNPKKLGGSTIYFAVDGLAYDFDAFRSACVSSGSRTVSSLIRKSFPAFGSTLALESMSRADTDVSLKAGEMDSAALSAIVTGIRSVLADLATPIPRVYTSSDGVPGYFSLVPLRIAGVMKEEVFSDINRAIRSFLAGRGAKTEHDREKDSVVAPLRQQLEKGRRALRAIQGDAREAERARTYERFGNALMAGLPSLTKGLKTFNADIDGEHVSIAIEPALSPIQNAQRYFEKSKRAKAAGDESALRLREIARRIERLEKLLAEAERSLPGDRAGKFLDEHAAEFEEVGLGLRSREKERLPFRVFTVDGGFEVWAGKNGANNDLLTLRYAKPDDLWFHARGGSGSHVVLKTRSAKGDPGKRACEQAAGIAAYYSKMKTAGTVAVAMTERRFVRKPRGSPPGTVVIEREKVIFAQPSLPRGGGH
jgi:predicted ribosome quality control (RQC) complex YloA/Tae2 family protein